MRRQIWLVGTAFALSAAVGLAQASQTTTAGAGAASPATQLVITGCVQRAPSATSGGVGTAGTATTTAPTTPTGMSNFVLTNASTSTTSPSTTTSGSNVAAAASKGSYRLEGEDSKFSPHVGHQVEISGTIENQSRSGAAATTTGAPSATGTTGNSASATNVPVLKVDSVRMVSSSCPE
jgi:hypothetical protein